LKFHNVICGEVTCRCPLLSCGLGLNRERLRAFYYLFNLTAVREQAPFIPGSGGPDCQTLYRRLLLIIPKILDRARLSRYVCLILGVIISVVNSGPGATSVALCSFYGDNSYE